MSSLPSAVRNSASPASLRSCTTATAPPPAGSANVSSACTISPASGTRSTSANWTHSTWPTTPTRWSSAHAARHFVSERQSAAGCAGATFGKRSLAPSNGTGPCTRQPRRVRHALHARAVAVEARQDHLLGVAAGVGLEVGVAAIAEPRSSAGSDSMPVMMICGRTWPLLLEPGGVARMPPSVDGADVQEVRHLDLVVLEVAQQRVDLLQERARRGERRVQAAQDARERGQPRVAGADERVEVVEQVLEVGRELAERTQRRLQVVEYGLEVGDQRRRVRRERLQPRQRALRLVEEGREDPDRGGELLAAARQLVEQLGVAAARASSARPRRR